MRRDTVTGGTGMPAEFGVDLTNRANGHRPAPTGGGWTPPRQPATPPVNRWATATWVAGLIVGLAGAVLTCTGLYSVAHGAGVPWQIAWLYPVCTDGLALTAYAATSVLTRRATRMYAWAVVVLCAGLSGFAQFLHLAQGGGLASTVTADWLRGGIGGWPALSVAVAAHLVWIVSRVRVPAKPEAPEAPATLPARLVDNPAPPDDLRRWQAVHPPVSPDPVTASVTRHPANGQGDGSMVGRAVTAALAYEAEHGERPTRAKLAVLVGCSTSTARDALGKLAAAKTGAKA